MAGLQALKPEHDRCRYLTRVRRATGSAWVDAPPSDPWSFHRRVSPAHTPLVEAPKAAELIGAAEVLVKDESQRMGTHAFKVLGASWAMFKVLCARAGAPPPDDWRSFDDLAEYFKRLGDLTFVAATDGNHGHAVAFAAARMGFKARILMPESAPPVRLERVAAEGAEIVVVAGNYDDAVALASEHTSDREVRLPDTAWPGYEEIAQIVSDGYGTLFSEVDRQLGAPLTPDDVVAVQIGVGTFGSTAVRHYCSRSDGPRLIGVESTAFACVLASAAAGEAVEVRGTHESTMDCLNAGVASTLALPLLDTGLDVLIAVSDDLVADAVSAFAAAGVAASPTGASGLAGLLGFAETAAGRAYLKEARVILVNTEGPLS